MSVFNTKDQRKILFQSSQMGVWYDRAHTGLAEKIDPAEKVSRIGAVLVLPNLSFQMGLNSLIFKICLYTIYTMDTIYSMYII
jgi:hypothetical protein